jgi:1,4-alpha-glucan branching enzyme
VTSNTGTAGSGRIVTDYEAYLFGEGHWLRAWEKMGARPARREGREGYSFVVWAPNARAVSVIGSFNDWNPGAHPLQVLGVSGLWETFVPGLGAGELYKFSIQPAFGPPLE